jgi:hypothetical protein
MAPSLPGISFAASAIPDALINAFSSKVLPLIKDIIITGVKNKIENIPLGKYILKEKVASTGYLLDTNEYNIEITKDNLNVKLNVYEQVIKRKVEIFKVLASNATGELSPEKNVTFEIYNK